MYGVLKNGQEVHCSNEVFWHKNGSAIPVEYWVQPIATNSEMLGAVGTFIDISERKKAENYEQFRSGILELLVTNKPLTTILEALAVGVEQLNSAMVCSILLLDNEGKHFDKGIAPSLPDFYNEAIKGVEIGIGAGFCRTSTITEEAIIIEDIATHPYWTPYREIAVRAGISACWSLPILSSLNTVLGTFAIFQHKTVSPEESVIALIKQSARLASLAIERKQAEIELRIAATAFESQEGMLVSDTNNNILRINSAFSAITGYSPEDVVGKNPHIFQSGQHDASFYAAMWKSINDTGAWQGEVWNRRKSGEVFPEYLTVTAVKDQNNIVSNYVATLTDITLRKEAVDKIERLAFYDPLTGLPNRRLLQDRLKPALASSHRSGLQGALLFIDMDNFKTLNDTLGHDMGDLLLQQVAKRLESCMREGDTVARLGGDEFVVMLEDLSEQTLEAATQTEVIGNKILTILNLPYQLATYEYRSTPSIGAVLFNGQEQLSEELLKQADIAMYQAKASGRNALRFFDPQMQASITARVALEEDLRLALGGDQFILYYQPQVSHNYQIIGAEVLIRWQHPVRGLVSPVDFIPLAEESNLILAIGQWVLKTACDQIKIWESSVQRQHLQLAVNVSSRQFYQKDFVEQVAQILSQNAINPNKLKLELTESLVLDDIEDTIFKMNALRKIGVRFSMDDFGTGYSSLSSLKKLPLDQLKIDQSFVRDISIDQDDTIIVETIIAMANKLNIEVIAEGVETETQRAFLEQHDCQLFQGYLFSKPVPIEQFELLLKKNSF
jgi:diguanylate cyclase (GGDEF)-like protein/PAS domain S-box-containing protein